MRYILTTDTHFGHDNLIKHNMRPPYFTEIVLQNINRSLRKDDILIHLGDVSFECDYVWTDQISKMNGRHWLVKGNHDRQTNTWYMDHGWDFVADSFSMSYFGLNILFSHIPQKDGGFDLNIHGHFHNTDHRKHEPHIEEILTYKHWLLALEFNNYDVWYLENIVKKFRKDRLNKLIGGSNG